MRGTGTRGMAKTPRGSRPLGDRVRQLRTDRAMTLARLSEHSGISVSTLSKLENGQTGLSLDNVIRLSAAFGMPVSILINEHGPAGGSYSVARADDPFSHGVAQLEFKVLHDDLPGQRNIFWQVRVKAHTLESFGPLRSHPGEEFFYVLSGQVALHLEGEAPIVLKVGDSVQFDSAIGHAYISRSRKDALILMSNTITDLKPAGYREVAAGSQKRSHKQSAPAIAAASVNRKTAPPSHSKSRKKQP
jgi:transcriptional regulator with XRE-family HTH domain